MGTIENILSFQLNHDMFRSEDDKVSGIAKRAVDIGYDQLTERQKSVLGRHLTKYCTGHTNPGGHHNDCDKELSGDELLDAYTYSEDPESLQCDSCRDEAGYEQHVRDNYFRD